MEPCGPSAGGGEAKALTHERIDPGVVLVQSAQSGIEAGEGMSARRTRFGVLRLASGLGACSVTSLPQPQPQRRDGPKAKVRAPATPAAMSNRSCETFDLGGQVGLECGHVHGVLPRADDHHVARCSLAAKVHPAAVALGDHRRKHRSPLGQARCGDQWTISMVANRVGLEVQCRSLDAMALHQRLRPCCCGGGLVHVRGLGEAQELVDAVDGLRIGHRAEFDAGGPPVQFVDEPGGGRPMIAGADGSPVDHERRMACLRIAGLSTICTLMLGCSSPDKSPATPTPQPAMQEELEGFIEHRAPHAGASAAYRWVDIMLEVTGREVDAVGARPTIISRQMAIPMTAMYDAWVAYDERAVGTRLGGSLRRPVGEHTQANKEKAIAHAIHLTLVDLFPGDRAWLDEQMRQMGHDPEDASSDLATPQGVGRAAAMAVLDHRRHDGANQGGDMPGSNGEPYSDYTGYVPKNTVDQVNDPDSWQPIPFSDGNGGTFAPGFLTPHWYRVVPFALESSDQFRPPPQPRVGSPELQRDVDECVELNGTLSLEHKSIVEFMRDGPRSTGQSGHWLQFAQDVSRRDGHDLDADVKLFFAIANTAFDAFIASWEGKRYYDSSRPWTLIRSVYYADAEIVGYLGECKGAGTLSGSQWFPYSPPTFVTPPFPGYPSGHSTISGACAKMLELFTGSDRFGAYERHQAGMYTEAECTAEQMQARDGQPGAAASKEVLLKMPTFTATAELAGISRVMGGYHIQADNTEGLELGRKVAQYSWPKYQAYFDGTAPSGQ
mgnify:CR=1 FL=1